MVRDDDWREQRALRLARWMQNQCARCPACGAMVCGDKQKDDHRDFHTTLNDQLDTARDAIVNARNRISTLETKVAELELRLPPL